MADDLINTKEMVSELMFVWLGLAVSWLALLCLEVGGEYKPRKHDLSNGQVA